MQCDVLPETPRVFVRAVTIECAPSGEGEAACNGVDDDCDGTFDEDYTAVKITCAGSCVATGRVVCIDGIQTDTCELASPPLGSTGNADCDWPVDAGNAIDPDATFDAGHMGASLDAGTASEPTSPVEPDAGGAPDATASDIEPPLSDAGALVDAMDSGEGDAGMSTDGRPPDIGFPARDAGDRADAGQSNAKLDAGFAMDATTSPPSDSADGGAADAAREAPSRRRRARRWNCQLTPGSSPLNPGWAALALLSLLHRRRRRTVRASRPSDGGGDRAQGR